MAVAVAEAPQVLACDAALKLGCSLSPELSRLLSASRGTCQLNAQGQGAETRSTKGRVVSYIPGDDGTSHHRERAKKTTRCSAELAELEPETPPVQLDFDPEQVFEYVSNPLTGKAGHVVERGALWLDGKSASRVDDLWRGLSAGYKAAQLLQGTGAGGRHGHGASSALAGAHHHGTGAGAPHGSPDVCLVRVVDCPEQGMLDVHKASVAAAATGVGCSTWPMDSAAAVTAQLAAQSAGSALAADARAAPGLEIGLASSRMTASSPQAKPVASRRLPARRPASAGSTVAPSKKTPALTPPKKAAKLESARPTAPSSPKTSVPAPITVPLKSAVGNCSTGTPRTARQRWKDPESESGSFGDSMSPSMMQVSGCRWDFADIIEKRQLVRGAVPRAGEVSSLIHQVQRPRSLSRRSPRRCSHIGTL